MSGSATASWVDDSTSWLDVLHICMWLYWLHWIFSYENFRIATEMKNTETRESRSSTFTVFWLHNSSYRALPCDITQLYWLLPCGKICGSIKCNTDLQRVFASATSAYTVMVISCSEFDVQLMIQEKIGWKGFFSTESLSRKKSGCYGCLPWEWLWKRSHMQPAYISLEEYNTHAHTRQEAIIVLYLVLYTH